MSEAPATLTHAETIVLLNALVSGRSGDLKGRQNVRNYCMALLMLDAGLRVGEVVQLRISDLWFNDSPVSSLTIRAEITKTHSERQIPVSSRLSSAIAQIHTCCWTQPGKAIGNYAFHNPSYLGHVTVRQVQNIIRNAARSSIGRAVHPHVLRHTFATNLMRRTDMRTVQALLGHKCLSSTQVYTHPNGDDLKAAIEALST